MFEDRRIRRKRRYIIAAVFLLFSGIAFGIGYYLNVDDSDNMLVPESQPKARLPIPDSLINPVTDNRPYGEVNEEDDVDTTVNYSGSGVVSEETVIGFKTCFTLCGHSVERTSAPSEDEIRMTELQIRAKYRDWELLDFSSAQVSFERKIETHCPKHFIIGVDNGYIAIFVYNENGEKVLKESTDIPVSTLMPEDQKSLESGIIADTKDDLEQKLEGFSE